VNGKNHHLLSTRLGDITMNVQLHKLFSSVKPASQKSTCRGLRFERLERREVPAGLVAVGIGPGPGPVVALYHDTNNDGVPDGAPIETIPVLNPSFKGGVHVAVGHFTSTVNFQLAVAGGSGGSRSSPTVQIFQLDANDLPTGNPETFLAAGFGKNVGLNLAREHSDGATFDSLLVSADSGAPRISVYNDGTTIGGAVANDGLLANSQIDTFLVFKSSFHGGVRIAAGRNLAAAGSDFVAAAPGPGGSPEVAVLKDTNNDLLLSDNLAAAERFMPVGKNWKGGLTVALGDVGSPSTNPELIFGRGKGGLPQVLIFSDTNLNGLFADDTPTSFLAYDSKYTGGVNVAASRLSSANVGQSGEIIVAPASHSNFLLPVEVFKSTTNTGEVAMGDAPKATFFPFGLLKDSFFATFDGNGI
jgi:hypothetical protein